MPKIREIDLSGNRISNIAGWETLPTTARINVTKNSLPLSFLYHLQQDQIATGRAWIYDDSQNHIGGDIKLKQGEVYDLGREAVIGGQPTMFKIWNVSDKSRAFPADDAVSQDKDGRLIFKKPGKFQIVMSNKAVTVFESGVIFGLLAPYRFPKSMRVG